MSNRFAMIVILAEDERSANLPRRYAIRALGINNWRIRQVISLSGRATAVTSFTCGSDPGIMAAGEVTYSPLGASRDVATWLTACDRCAKLWA